jgi:hypothetical protein
MNRLIILFAMLYSLIGCERTYNTSSEYWKSFVNRTDNVFFYVVRTSAGSDSAFSYGNDSISFYFALHGTVTLPFVGPYYLDVDMILPIEEKLYNLTDTSVFLYSGHFVSGSGKDSLYRKYISYSSDGSRSSYNSKYLETLAITDTLLHIMQKDYSMLEKFSEHYEQK